MKENLYKDLQKAFESLDVASREELLASVGAKPVVRGHWIGLEYDGYADGYPVYDLWECSICGNEICGTDAPEYCCDCGAKMDEVE